MVFSFASNVKSFYLQLQRLAFFFILYYLRYFRLTLDASLKIALLYFLEIRAGNDSEEWVVSRTCKYFISKKIRMIILLELRFKALSHAHDQRRKYLNNRLMN